MQLLLGANMGLFKLKESIDVDVDVVLWVFLERHIGNENGKEFLLKVDW